MRSFSDSAVINKINQGIVIKRVRIGWENHNLCEEMIMS